MCHITHFLIFRLFDLFFIESGLRCVMCDGFPPCSDPQFIINDHSRLSAPPFTSSFLLLIRCFPLIHVTMKSSASNFTITMASSESPRFITSALLHRLELKESQLLRLKLDGSSLGKIVNSLSIYLPSIRQQVTVRILDFGGRRHLILLLPPYKGSLAFR